MFVLHLILLKILLHSGLTLAAPDNGYEFILTYTDEIQKRCPYGTIQKQRSCQECSKTYFRQNAGSISDGLGIVGGREAVKSSWPAQVFIQQKVSQVEVINGRSTLVEATFACGGTIINAYTILTAAHCIVTQYQDYKHDFTVKVKDPFDPKAYSIWVGAHDLSEMNKAPAKKLNIIKLIRHPNYDEKSMLNDIALYIVDKPIEFNEYVQPACLSKHLHKIHDNSYVFAAGWGTLSYEGNAATKLQNIRLTYYPPRRCSLVSPHIEKNWHSQICAGEYNGGRDTCQGDSGGGLYQHDRKINKFIVVGIVSYGDGCAIAQKPGIYTRVSHYHKWITKNWQ